MAQEDDALNDVEQRASQQPHSTFYLRARKLVYSITGMASVTLAKAPVGAKGVRVATRRATPRSVITAALPTPFDAISFAPIRESEVSRAMSSRCARRSAAPSVCDLPPL